ncbi:MAG TPA: UrcA family protein [Sphingomonas sp.]|nr:UrcA family protein [Sphingomonas sp.]
MLKPILMTALLVAALPAFAGEKPVPPRARVTTADLDLSTAAGRQALDRRLRVAIDQVCAAADSAPRAGILPNDRCRSVATASARRQRSLLIAAIDAGKNHKAGMELAATMVKAH